MREQARQRHTRRWSRTTRLATAGVGLDQSSATTNDIIAAKHHCG